MFKETLESIDDKDKEGKEVESTVYGEEEDGDEDFEDDEDGEDENDDEGTADEYNVNTFVYYRRRPFSKEKFVSWAENNPRNIIRSKGILLFIFLSFISMSLSDLSSK